MFMAMLPAAVFGIGLLAFSALCIWATRFPWFNRLQEKLGFADDPEWLD